MRHIMAYLSSSDFAKWGKKPGSLKLWIVGHFLNTGI